jgi:hypothetical protein
LQSAQSALLAKSAYEAALSRQAQQRAAEQAKNLADEAKIQTGLLQRAADAAEKKTRLLVEDKTTDEQAFALGYVDCYNDGACYLSENYGELSERGTISKLPPIWKENPFIYLNLKDAWCRGWFVRFNELMGEAINGPGVVFMRQRAFQIGYSDMKNWDLKRKWADPNIDEVEITWTGGIADFIFCRNHPKLLDVYSSVFIDENGFLSVTTVNLFICDDELLNIQYRKGIESYIETTNDEKSRMSRKNRHRVTSTKRIFSG